MKVIYQPTGKAREYAELACNLFTGCLNKCTYCYVPAVLHKKPAEFHSQCIARKGILQQLARDLKKLPKGSPPVLFCFTTDPYQRSEDWGLNQVTRDALTMCRSHGVNFKILTKNPVFAIKDADLYTPDDWFGVTLTSVDDKKLMTSEGNTDIFWNRCGCLKKMSDRGINTWVSLEPVIDPVEALRIIDWTYKYVDFYAVGKINYQKSSVDWAKFANQVTRKLRSYKKKFLIKESLRKYLIEEPIYK